MPLFPIISIAYHMKVRFYPHIYRLSRILYFQQVISPHQYKTKFGKRYEYKPREKYVCISRIKWKYVWEISNLHWTATEWCLQEILILKTEMACAPYGNLFLVLLNTLLPWVCWSPTEGTMVQETKGSWSRSLETTHCGHTSLGLPFPSRLPWVIIHLLLGEEFYLRFSRSVGLAQEQIHRPMEQNSKARNIPMSIWSVNIW